MKFIALVILIALAQYLFFTVQVGLKRGKHGVKAPQTSGHETWNRLFRVQQNTMEQLVIFIPSMIAFGMYASARWAVLPGVLFIIGRQVYYHQYLNDPASRTPGMAMSLLSNAILLIGALIGLIVKMI